MQEGACITHERAWTSAVDDVVDTVTLLAVIHDDQAGTLHYNTVEITKQCYEQADELHLKLPTVPTAQEYGGDHHHR